MNQTRRHTQAEHEAFEAESQNFLSPGIPPAEIRQMLGIPERLAAGGLRNINNNIIWNEIRDDVRKIMRNRDLDDPDEWIDIANELGNLKSLSGQTSEPRIFFEWFRYNYGRNLSKVKKRKLVASKETEINRSLDQGSGRSASGVAEPMNGTDRDSIESGEPISTIQNANQRDWWNVVN
ncbi:hypothetical protein TWF718_009653 [Orbilia javanica]|uniref:Uncharacterized protein n=1 Tax=Orbilia javanica TaxID=47235 RepID=A0AAN8RFU0_9PEZI